MDSNAIAQQAHDIRNTLGTVALYLEPLEHEADTVRILARSDAPLKKATSMCSDLMREAARSGMRMPRQTFDVTPSRRWSDSSLHSSRRRRRSIS